MSKFYHPSARPVSRNSLLRGDFFAPAPDMRGITPVDHDLDCRFASITFIGTEMLRFIWRRRRPVDDQGIQNHFQLSDIMPIGPGDDEGEWGATLFHQHLAFAAVFFPGPSGSDPPPPVPRGLWSWRCQYSATTRKCPPCHHIQPTRRATGPEIPRPVPTGESRHGWNWGFHRPLWGEPSIGSPCGEHTQDLQIPGDNRAAFCRRLFSGY
jgi:hypothetical protein